MTHEKMPEALRLADALEQSVQCYPQMSEDEPGGYYSEIDQTMDFAAAELRRQHAEIEWLREEVNGLRKDAERLDFLETTAKESRTGVSVDYAKYAEGGMVLERGYRVMRHHKLCDRLPTIRQAIDAARQKY